MLVISQIRETWLNTLNAYFERDVFLVHGG